MSERERERKRERDRERERERQRERERERENTEINMLQKGSVRLLPTLRTLYPGVPHLL